MKALSNKSSIIIISIIVLIGFHLTYGLEILLPNNINWLMAAYHDWGQHYLGWAFYKSEPWSFPIGQIQNYHYPSGSNIGFTDSIPLLAIPLKIFADIFNEDFQYFGIFLLSSHFLMAFFSFKLFTFYRLPKLAAIFGSILLAFNPVILYRAMHPALTAQWLIIASLYLYAISSSTKNVKRIVFIQLILLLISSLITPYLFAIVFGFSIVLLVKLLWIDKTISISSAFFNFCLTVFLPLLLWYIVGMISFNEETSLSVSNSYGLYAWNLNGFVNSKGYSSFLKELPHFNIHQYEGYSYLGLGVITLAIVVVFSFIIKRSYVNFNKECLKNFTPIIIFIIAITAFAILPKISLGSEMLVEFPSIPIVSKLGEIFRASGRFIWVLYYVIVISAVILFFKLKLNNNLKIFGLLFLVIVQFFDTKLFFTQYKFENGSYQIENFNQPIWDNVLPYFSRIITYPPFRYGLKENNDYQDLCFLAQKHGVPITTGYVARVPDKSDKLFADSLKKAVSVGNSFQSSLYITTIEHILDFEKLINNQNYNIGILDGYYLLYPDSIINKYISMSLKQEVNLSDSLSAKYSNISQAIEMKNSRFSSNNLKYNLETISQISDIVKVKGWAFKKGQVNSSNDSLFFVLFNEKRSYEFSLHAESRPDVTSYFKAEDLSKSGFNSLLNTRTLESGNYKLAIKIKNQKVNELFRLNNNQETISISN